MQISSNLRRRLIRLSNLALLAFCFSQLPAQAQEQKRQVTVIQDMVVGLVPGQTLRLTLFNPEGNPQVSGHVKVFDGGGALLFQTPEVEIGPGEFHSFDIDRSNISVAGDPRTGRFQARARLIGLRRASAREDASNVRARIDRLPRMIELIDNETGKTTAMLLPAVHKVREAANRGN